jgi:hypothetical protein
VKRAIPETVSGADGVVGFSPEQAVKARRSRNAEAVMLPAVRQRRVKGWDTRVVDGIGVLRLGLKSSLRMTTGRGKERSVKSSLRMTTEEVG